MKIFVLDCDTFEAANICNYLIQHTNHQVIGWIHSSNSKSKYPHLETAISSRSRFNLNFYDNPENKFNQAFTSALNYHQPDIIIGPLTYDSLVLEDVLPKHIKQIRWLSKEEAGTDNSFVIEGKSNILYVKTPKVFGITQATHEMPARLFQSALNGIEMDTEDDEQEYIYIKDLYFFIEMSLEMFKPGILEINTGMYTTESDIMSFLKSIVVRDPRPLHYITKPTLANAMWQHKYMLDAALEHTLQWYAANTWIKQI